MKVSDKSRDAGEIVDSSLHSATVAGGGMWGGSGFGCWWQGGRWGVRRWQGQGGGAGAEESVMSTCQSRAPAGSLCPQRMVLPRGSWTSRWSLLTMAVQPASHSFPRLMRLLEKLGMMCPVRACSIGMAGIARRAVAKDVQASPEAVRIVVRGAAMLMWRRGAVEVK